MYVYDMYDCKYMYVYYMYIVNTYSYKDGSYVLAGFSRITVKVLLGLFTDPISQTGSLSINLSISCVCGVAVAMRAITGTAGMLQITL